MHPPIGLSRLRQERRFVPDVRQHVSIGPERRDLAAPQDPASRSAKNDLGTISVYRPKCRTIDELIVPFTLERALERALERLMEWRMERWLPGVYGGVSVLLCDRKYGLSACAMRGGGSERSRRAGGHFV